MGPMPASVENKDDASTTHPTAPAPTKAASSFNESFRGTIFGTKNTQQEEEEEEAIKVPQASTHNNTADKATPSPQSPPQRQQTNATRKAEGAPGEESAPKKRRDSKQATPGPAQQADETRAQLERVHEKTDIREQSDAEQSTPKVQTESEKLEASKAESSSRVRELEQSFENAVKQFFASISTENTAQDQPEEVKREVQAAEDSLEAAKH